MIDLFFATSVNVYKIVIALEEMDLDYRINLIDISKGEQRDPTNLAGSPTGKIPVIRDNDPADGGEPEVLFESAAILMYLSEKTGKLMPTEPRARRVAMQWLIWQAANLGPISGQAWHFFAFAPLLAPDFDNSYSHSRYFKMMSELWTVMDQRLSVVPYLAGEYSLADIACYPWIIYFDPLEGMDAYPNIKAWRDRVMERPAVRRSYAKIAQIKTGYVFLPDRKVAVYPWDDVAKNMITT